MFGIKMRALQKDGGRTTLEFRRQMFTYKLGLNLSAQFLALAISHFCRDSSPAGPVIDRRSARRTGHLSGASFYHDDDYSFLYPLKHRDAAEPMPGKRKLIDRVRVVHTQVNDTGHLDKQLVSLRTIRRRIESAVAREAGVRREVSADVLTRRGIVLYDTARAVDEIKRRVRGAVGNPSPPPSDAFPPSMLCPLRPVKPMVSYEMAALLQRGGRRNGTR